MACNKPHPPHCCIGSFFSVLAASLVSQACSRPSCDGPYPLVFFLGDRIGGRFGPFAKRSDTEMAPRKSKKQAAGPAKAPRTITRPAELEANLKRFRELKAKFAGVAKALRPALAEMAGRTAQRLEHPTYHKDGRLNAQYRNLVVELEQARDSNIARHVAYYETHKELRAISAQHETLQEMTTVETHYKVVHLSRIMTAGFD